MAGQRKTGWTGAQGWWTLGLKERFAVNPRE
jgi:hypothetical protein